MAAKKLTPQVPGEPVKQPVADEIASHSATGTGDQQSGASIQGEKAEVQHDAGTEPAADKEPVKQHPRAGFTGELPDMADIDPAAISRPVLTKQGYVMPASKTGL